MNFPIDFRNEKLLNIFTQFGFDVKLIGNINQPKLIIDNCYAISGFVHNYNFNFTTKPFGGSIVQTIDVRTSKITHSEINKLIASTQRRQLWKVALAHNDDEHQMMYYVKTDNCQPLFAMNDARFFFDEDSAVSCQQYLSDTHQIACCVTTTIFE